MTEQLALFDPPFGAEPGPVRLGLLADLAHIAAADRVGREAVIALAIEAADAADAAHRRGDAYALTAAIRELRQTIDMLPITIVPGGATGADPADPFNELLVALSADNRHA